MASPTLTRALGRDIGVEQIERMPFAAVRLACISWAVSGATHDILHKGNAFEVSESNAGSVSASRAANTGMVSVMADVIDS